MKKGIVIGNRKERVECVGNMDIGLRIVLSGKRRGQVDRWQTFVLRGQEIRGKRSMFDLRKPNPTNCQNFGKDNGDQRGRKLVTICFKCGEPGHIVRNCPQWGKAP